MIAANDTDSLNEYQSPQLELGCGTGRVLIPTARAGVDMVGLDLSPHMLQVCQTRVLNEPEAEALLDRLEICGHLPAEVAVGEDGFTVLFSTVPPPLAGRHPGIA